MLVRIKTVEWANMLSSEFPVNMVSSDLFGQCKRGVISPSCKVWRRQP